jgi:hypothetical protein
VEEIMSRWKALKSDNKSSNNAVVSNAQSSSVPPRTNSRWSAPKKTTRNDRNRPSLELSNSVSTWVDVKAALSDAKDPAEFEKAVQKQFESSQR